MLKEIPKAKRFNRGNRLHVRAQQVWLILTAHVMYRKSTITYKDLATAMGYENPRAAHTLGRQLGIVGWFCTANDLPPLNAIVVNQSTGLPGHEVVLRRGRSVPQEQAAVFATDW